MSVRIRLKRMGRRHSPFYRIAAMDKRRARDSKVIELLGYYDPVNKDESMQYKLNVERIQYWISVGAQPSDTVRSLIRRAGEDGMPPASAKAAVSKPAPAPSKPAAKETPAAESPAKDATATASSQSEDAAE